MFAGLSIILLLLGALVLGVRMRWQRKRLQQSYAEVAEDFHGYFFPGDAWECPSVRFSHDGMPVCVLASNEIVHVDARAASGTSSRYYTQLHIVWPEATRCEVAPRLRLAWQRVWPQPNILTGCERFDERFAVHSEETEFALQVINDEVQDRLMRLRYLKPTPDLYVRFGDGTLVIKKRGIIRSATALKRFVRLSLEMYDLALSSEPLRDRLAQMLGIEFIEGFADEDLGEAICPYCGDDFQCEQAVVCKRCRTPHHRDCWNAYRMCTTFGCGEVAYDIASYKVAAD